MIVPCNLSLRADPLVICKTGIPLRRGHGREPKRPAEGIVHVLVNGQIALTDGAFTGVRSGAVLRRGQI